MNNPLQPNPSELAQQIRASIKSILLKNLVASPSFTRICRQALGLKTANSNQSKNLTKTNNSISRGPHPMPSKQQKAPQPPAPKAVRNCQHIKVTGVACRGPAMRGEQFCYFHQRMWRGVKTPPNARLHPIALIEDEESIQASLMEVINALARNHIDLRRASLILKALNIAVRNARYARLHAYRDDMVRDIPNYPAPPKPAASPAHAPEEEDPELKARATENALAQLQSRALATIPAPTLIPMKPHAPAAPVATSAPAMPEARQVPAAAALALDPTQRKPPARAGTPATTRIAVNQHKTRT